MNADFVGHLRNLLQVLALCLVVAALQVAFEPTRAWGPPLLYSVAIGTTVWAVIDVGRRLLPSARATGWPPGAQGIALVAAGIAAGWFIGNPIARFVGSGIGMHTPAASPATDTRDLIAPLLITIIASVVGTYYFYSRGRSAALERRTAQAERHASEARLKLLEAQLEPHMLFNTLANLRVLIALDAQRAQAMLDRLIAFLRASLAASRTERHALRQEFERIDDYLALMALRMGERLQVELSLPPALRERPVPPLLLQPLVENAIRHGLEPKAGPGRLSVRATAVGGERLRLEVQDDGIGLAATAAAPGVPAAPAHGGGFGTAQVRERLAVLYGARASFVLEPAAGGGTLARIELPLEP